jgi:hypothetical protein
MPHGPDSDDDDVGLVAPVVPVLKAILEEYPGGQLLEEALQDAEDQGAESFSLLLDKRVHADVHAAVRGPAFVLIDSGRGFGEVEWCAAFMLFPVCSGYNLSSYVEYTCL